MASVLVAIQGTSPLLLNRFTDETAAKVSAGSSTIGISSRGTPREQATPKLYTTSSGSPMVPGPNLFRCLVDAGVFHKAGRRAVTSAKSSLIPAGIQLLELECAITTTDGIVPTWEVDSRSVVIPSTGGRVMAHRPRFDEWRLSFTLRVDEQMFHEQITRRLIDDAGSKVGLGDFRPSRKGPFGRFAVVNWIWTSERQIKPTEMATRLIS